MSEENNIDKSWIDGIDLEVPQPGFMHETLRNGILEALKHWHETFEDEGMFLATLLADVADTYYDLPISMSQFHEALMCLESDGHISWNAESGEIRLSSVRNAEHAEALRQVGLQ